MSADLGLLPADLSLQCARPISDSLSPQQGSAHADTREADEEDRDAEGGPAPGGPGSEQHQHSDEAGQPDAPQRLGGLLSYRGHVESISEWPFDTALLLRFALYLLIPLGSWLGGALVERSLDSLLD